MTKSVRAFTIVELLIVIVVIAILAAISVVAYNGIQQRARASAASTGVSQAKKKLEYYKVENGSYPTTGNLATAGVSDGDTSYQYTSSDGTTFCITGTNGSVSYTVTNTTAPAQGGCAGHGQGGQSAVTNLAVNPAATRYSGNSEMGWQNNRFPGEGTYSLATGASDGPVTGLTTYARYTFAVAVGSGRGFHNVGNPNTATPGTVGASVTAGTTYTHSAYLRSSDGQGNAVMRVRYVDAANNWIGGSILSPGQSLAGGQWVRPTVTATAPAGAVRVQIHTLQEGTVPTHAIGDTLDGTGLMVTDGATTYNYADGNSSNWVWNGTAHASTSTGPAL